MTINLFIYQYATEYSVLSKMWLLCGNVIETLQLRLF